MSIKIELVELKDGQFTLFCSACMEHTRRYYLVGKSIICRSCVDELHLHLLNTRKHIASLSNGEDGEELRVCPESSLLSWGASLLEKKKDEPRVSMDSGIEWGLSQGDAL